MRSEVQLLDGPLIQLQIPFTLTCERDFCVLRKFPHARTNPGVKAALNAITLSNYFGLAAISLLTLNILIGLLLSTKYNPVRKWPHRRVNTLQLHNWTGYTALAVSLVHPVLILFSSTAHFRFIDIVYPINAPKQPYVNTIGSLALYLLLITVVTSYFRLEIGRKIWKPLHFATYALFALYAVHALLTDPNLKNAPFDPFDAEKVYVEFCILLVLIGIVLRIRWQLRQPAPRVHRPKAPRSGVWIIVVGASLGASKLAPAQATIQQSSVPTDRAATTDSLHSGERTWGYDPDAGPVFRKGDFKWTLWGFAERYWGPQSAVVSADAWRRVRQGMEFDLPRFNASFRPVAVYEVDLTNNNFFRSGRASQIFENFYLAIQNPEDASRFRVLFGENTHILSREDNLSSGNLPTINRSLILEEHGSVNSFGTQWGVEFFKAVSSRTGLALSAQDNRGSLNTAHPSYRVGNSIAAKLTSVVVRNPRRGRTLILGTGIDYTRSIYNRSFALSSAIGGEPLGGSTATGNKFSLEGDASYGWSVGSHPLLAEGEFIFSDFAQSLTDVSGGYAMLQGSIFEDPKWGDVYPFARYDVVRLGREVAPGRAKQEAMRVGANYNLPRVDKHISLHLEYALNHVAGPLAIVPRDRQFSELRLELRLNSARYIRH